MRRLWLATLLLPELALAACPGHIACLSWSASTGWSDGRPFAPNEVPVYVVYRVGTALTPIATTSELGIVLTNEPRGQTCWVVTARVGQAESVSSQTVCKLIRIAAPTDGSIEAPTDGAIEPRN